MYSRHNIKHCINPGPAKIVARSFLICNTSVSECFFELMQINLVCSGPAIEVGSGFSGRVGFRA